MTICADTSFLFSFYGSDVNTAAAQNRATESASVIHVHVVNSFEFENAVRLRFFQRKLSEVERDKIITGYRADIESGRVVNVNVPLTQVFSEAARLSAQHTETLGNRAYDILQVAAALRLGATEFWSFDGKQRTLAQAEGLSVRP